MDYCTGHNNEEHLKHHLKKVHITKKFFLKNFLIGLILMIILCVLAMIMKDSLWNWGETTFNLTAYDFRRIFVVLMSVWKLFLIQFALVPFLSLAMIEGHLKKHLNEK